MSAGARTVSVNPAERLIPPPLALTVTEYAPAAVVLAVCRLRLLLQDGVQAAALNAAVTPAGNPDAVKETFNMLCLLGSTNRQCAFTYVKLIDRLMNDRHRNLNMLPEKVRLGTYELLGSLGAFLSS